MPSRICAQLLAVCCVLLHFSLIVCRAQQDYQIGVGIADITGPAAETSMMGFAKPGQDSAGIHIRLFSRAFLVIDSTGKRVLMITCDLAMVSQIVKLEVIKRLQAKYAGVYRHENVLISATHTHSGPGGYLQYVLYIIASSGFSRQSLEAIVRGILLSIDRAHAMALHTRGAIFFNRGQLYGANINRSPSAYQANPQQERAKYQSDVDKSVEILKFVESTGRPLGVIVWFPVHCTSMNNSNILISGDNKGLASLLFEQAMNPGSLPGKGPFVAAFPNPNPGDVSPNTGGPHCMDTGLSCDNVHSTCNGRVEKCVGVGPGRDMFESTYIIGQKQYTIGRQLFKSATTQVSGPVGFVHQFIDMSKQQVRVGNGFVQTCKPAMGHSFAAGTTDGPGEFDFKQSTTQNNKNPFWNILRDVLRPPSPELVRCHNPKPILLATGEMTVPYDWQPVIVDVQVIRIGNILNIGLPGEFTTMAGRMIRQVVKSVAPGFQVLLSGLANSYTSYIVTPEEYSVQRYEGASCIYGPFTLLAYLDQYARLGKAAAAGQEMPATRLQPPNLLNRQIELRPGVLYDNPSFGRRFGDVVYDALPRHVRGTTVYVAFVAANPRNDLKQESSFLLVERKAGGNDWRIVATDSNWETRFYWRRTNIVTGSSEVSITWDIPVNQETGVYRIRYFGTSKRSDKTLSQFMGSSREFQVT